MSKVLVIQPTRGILYTAAQEALEREFTTLQQYPQVMRTNGVPLPDSRNLLIDAALENEWWEQLLFLDDDIVLPQGALVAMRRALKKADIAVIDYPHHRAEGLNSDLPKLGVAVWQQWQDGEPTEGKKLAWAGLGCVMIRRKALEKMVAAGFRFKGTAYPLFRTKDGTIKMSTKKVVRDDEPSAGEDIHFFFEANRLGLTTTVIPDMVAGHQHISRFVFRLAGGQYSTSHTLTTATEIEAPGNAQYEINPNL
jgi:Predicted glycosyltransferases